MSNSQRMFVEKLKDMKEKLNSADSNNLEVIGKELMTILESIVSDDTKEGREEAYPFDIERKMTLFAQNETIALCRVREADKEPYLKVQKENSVMPRAYEREGFEDSIWEALLKSSLFMLLFAEERL